MSSKLNYCVEASGQHCSGFHQTIEEENKKVYVWSCFMICGLPVPYILWFTVFLSCIQYVAFFKSFSVFLNI